MSKSGGLLRSAVLGRKLEVVTLVASPELSHWGRVGLGVESIYISSAVKSREGEA